MRVLVFGDSITLGYWATTYGWVERIRRFYDATKITHLDNYTEPDIYNVSISADNSDDILERIAAETKARTWRGSTEKPIVVVQIGVNDSCHEPDQPRVSLEQYRKNLGSIANDLRPISQKVILVGLSACDESRSAPVSWGEYYYTNAHLQLYEDVMREFAAAQNIDFIPVFEQFKARVDAGEDLLLDGLHPNDAGHELMYQIIMPKLQELLK